MWYLVLVDGVRLRVRRGFWLAVLYDNLRERAYVLAEAVDGIPVDTLLLIPNESVVYKYKVPRRLARVKYE